SPVRPTAIAPGCRRLEELLGVSLPWIVEAVYTTVGNGGVGPGYGLYDLDEAVASYSVYATPDPSEYPGWSWPKGLLPICDWGCAVYSFVDCTARQAA